MQRIFQSAPLTYVIFIAAIQTLPYPAAAFYLTILCPGIHNIIHRIFIEFYSKYIQLIKI